MLHSTCRIARKTAIVLCAVWTLLLCVNQSARAQTLSQRLRAESVETLATDARQQGNAVRGAILLTQQNLSCTRCHTAGAGKPVGPDLRQLGKEITDAYLVEALLEPSKTIKQGFESVTVLTSAGKVFNGRIVEDRPEQIVLQTSTGDFQRITLARTEIEEISPSKVSTMPDNLVDPLGNRNQFLDLVRYLMELSATDASALNQIHTPGGQTVGPELLGIVLLKEFNCEACHQDDVTQSLLTRNQPPDLMRSSGRINPNFIRQFVADPLATRPGTTMPHTLLGLPPGERQTAADEITQYLVSLSDSPFSTRPVEPDAATRGRELFHSIGCIACHSPRDDAHMEVLRESSVPLGAVHQKYNLDGLVAFLKDPLETRPSSRMPKMPLTHWEATELSNYLMSQSDGESAAKPFPSNPDLIEKGKARFQQLGCRQCHPLDSASSKPISLPLSKVRSDKGCLSSGTGDWPSFGLKAEQREAIRTALNRTPRALSDDDQIAITLTAFRCVNCHQRNELGGVPAERDSLFQTTNPNLGPQGRIPPALTGVGAKLNPNWMRQVLIGGRTIRPYVRTRMPQYGADNVAHVIDLFQRVDKLTPVEFPRVEDQKTLREIGTELIGTGGLNCIVCHTFQLQEAANMSSVDLTEMSERLQKDWFYHYMRNPQSLSQNTIMPTFWPSGRAMRTDILDGNSELQIEAIWQYLLEGRQARTPRGLIVEPIELVATDEAVMLRRSYPGIGKRGIGVGFPQQLNLVFDAEQLRLAMIWKGKFADPAGVWRSQGHGTVRMLGDNVMRFAPGPDLGETTNPWVVDADRPPTHRFKGYSLDAERRPRFRYEFSGIHVEDYSVDLVDPSTERPFLRRTVTLKSDSERSGLSFRAASGESIVRDDAGVFRIDGQLQIRIDDKHTGAIAEQSDFKELQIPLKVIEGTTNLTLEYRW